MNSHFIAGSWITSQGPSLQSLDSAHRTVMWTGRSAGSKEIDAAVAAARTALAAWSQSPLEERIAVCEKFAERVRAERDHLAITIARETGKPRWEARSEVDLVANKVAVSIESQKERCRELERPMGDATARARFKPHGVLAIFGPFNFPMHLPNGHMIPALLAGNAIIWKPSERTPSCGEQLTRIWESLDLPPGIVQMVQGAAETGSLLAAHPGIDGILFTGGSRGGLALHQALARQPQKILALEMGGNNPLVISRVADVDAAVNTAIVSAFQTSGQRCTCARRLIIPSDLWGDDFLTQFANKAERLRVGLYPEEPEPFMGPVIGPDIAEALLEAQMDLMSDGAEPVLLMDQAQSGYPALLRPGILDVTSVSKRRDSEIFGPLLQVIRVENFAEALDEANNTAYGLSASLLSDDPHEYERFYRTVRAGVINWNRPTNGASGALPFGGVGLSGNHRPAGSFAADYCAYPVASLESRVLQSPSPLPPGINP